MKSPNLLLLGTLIVFQIYGQAYAKEKSSTSNAKFGETVRDFVNNEVPKLSKELAITGTQRRLYEGNFLALLELSLETKLLAKELNDIEIKSDLISNIKNSKTALAAYDFYYGQESKVLKILGVLLDANKKIIEISKICEKGEQHNLQNLVSADIFNMALPKKDYSIAGYNDGTVTLVINIVNLFFGSKTAKQIGMMEEAISKIPEKIVSQKDMETIFKESCEDMDVKLKSEEHIATSSNNLKKIREMSHEKLKVLRKNKREAVSLYYDFRVKDIYRSTGLAEAESVVLERNKIHKKHQDLTRIGQKLRQEFLNGDHKLSHELLRDIYQDNLRHNIYHQNYLKAFSNRDFPFVKMALIELERQKAFDEMAYQLQKQQLGEDNETTSLY